jgi:hypothetical protein
MYRCIPTRAISNNLFRRLPAFRKMYSGLLSGVEDVTTAEYYSTAMEIPATIKFLNDEGKLFKAALEDSRNSGVPVEVYLKNIKDTANIWMNEDNVCDRALLIAKINDILLQNGRFVCLLGGKSTGKSLLMRDFVKKRKEGSVIRVNMRSFSKDGNILVALLHELARATPKTYSDLMKEWLHPTVEAAASVGTSYLTGEATAVSLPPLFASARLSTPESELLSRTLHFLGNKFKEPLTLVIDEANDAFTSHGEGQQQQRKRNTAKSDLEVLTTHSKELRTVSLFIKVVEFSFNHTLNFVRLT